MSDADSRLLQSILHLADQLSVDQVASLAAAIRATGKNGGTDANYRILSAIPQPHLQPLVRRVIDTWLDSSDITADSIALMLQTARSAIEQTRSRQRLDLVWTGPDPVHSSLRRTDQALLEVILAARLRLLLVSFAIYMLPAIETALLAAASRGVDITICLETPETYPGMDYDTVAALGDPVRRHATLYVWPRNRRPIANDGRSGAMHAKCAVADRSLLFVSSANLTGQALSHNIELGVLVRGGALPGQVAQHFGTLIQQGILTRRRDTT